MQQDDVSGTTVDLADRHVSAVRRERSESDRIVPYEFGSERANGNAFFGVPEHDEPILATGYQTPSVRRKANAPNDVDMSFQNSTLTRRGHVPKSDGAIVATQRERPSVGGKRQTSHRLGGELAWRSAPSRLVRPDHQ
jgi:hypothetical protein